MLKNRILLALVLLSVTTIKLSAIKNYVQTITMMIGDTITLNPYTDMELKGASLADVMTYTITDGYNNVVPNSAFTINPIKINSMCYSYEVIGLRRGSYKMTVTSRYYRKAEGITVNTYVTGTYHINIVDVTSIKMPPSLNLQPGSTYTLTPQILETGSTSELTWTSSNTGVAVVNNSGTIRVLRVGETNITCTAYNGVSATCRLTVIPIIAENFTLESTTYELEKGETVTLVPAFYPSNTTDQSVTYKSSDTRVATVTSEGIVTAIGKGNCTIKASTNDGSYLNATCSITVKPTVVSINIQNTMEMTVGQSNVLEPVILEEGATTTIDWYSSNTSVATVDSDGRIYAVSAGKSTITAVASNGVSASCAVTVNPLPNYLHALNTSVVIGSQVTLPILMVNKEQITACQFELALPEGVSISAYKLTNRKADQNVRIEQLANGNYQVVVFSSASKAFSGTNGSILDLTLATDLFMSTGTYIANIKNIELTTTEATTINPVNVNVQLTVNDYQLGDTNGDGKISITDAVAIVNYILGNASASYVAEASDVNGDGKTSITDAVAIVNKILSGENASKARMEQAVQYKADLLDPQ